MYKISNSEKYLKDLNMIFERKDLPFEVSEKICDLMETLFKSKNKYDKLHDKIIFDNFVFNNDTEKWEKSENTDMKFVNSEFEKLNNLEEKYNKQIIPKFSNISPKEMLCLKTFFEFE